MEAPVEGVEVLGSARLAHRKRGHRGAGAIVRQGGDDRPARPAVGAVGEGVAEAAVGRVECLGQAVGAGGGVGQFGRWWRSLRRLNV